MENTDGQNNASNAADLLSNLTTLEFDLKNDKSTESTIISSELSQSQKSQPAPPKSQPPNAKKERRASSAILDDLLGVLDFGAPQNDSDDEQSSTVSEMEKTRQQISRGSVELVLDSDTNTNTNTNTNTDTNTKPRERRDSSLLLNNLISFVDDSNVVGNINDMNNAVDNHEYKNNKNRHRNPPLLQNVIDSKLRLVEKMAYEMNVLRNIIRQQNQQIIELKQRIAAHESKTQLQTNL